MEQDKNAQIQKQKIRNRHSKYWKKLLMLFILAGVLSLGGIYSQKLYQYFVSKVEHQENINNTLEKSCNLIEQKLNDLQKAITELKPTLNKPDNTPKMLKRLEEKLDTLKVESVPSSPQPNELKWQALKGELLTLVTLYEDGKELSSPLATLEAYKATAPWLKSLLSPFTNTEEVPTYEELYKAILTQLEKEDIKASENQETWYGKAWRYASKFVEFNKKNDKSSQALKTPLAKAIKNHNHSRVLQLLESNTNENIKQYIPALKKRKALEDRVKLIKLLVGDE